MNVCIIGCSRQVDASVYRLWDPVGSPPSLNGRRTDILYNEVYGYDHFRFCDEASLIKRGVQIDLQVIRRGV